MSASVDKPEHNAAYFIFLLLGKLRLSDMCFFFIEYWDAFYSNKQSILCVLSEKYGTLPSFHFHMTLKLSEGVVALLLFYFSQNI